MGGFMAFFGKKLKEVEHYSTIKMLTEIRTSNYRMSLVNRISAEGFADMKALVLSLGNKILKANYSDYSDQKLLDAQSNFTKTIDTFFSVKSKFAMASFSAQLLQYYTIICHKEFIPSISLQEFLEFLAKNAHTLGNVDNNLFITEYKLIKIYNDLCVFTDATNGKIAPILDMEEKIAVLLEQLNAIKLRLDNWLLDAPDNIFLHYLSFTINYSCAKALELQYHMKKNTLELDDKLLLSDCQAIFLTAAKESLQKMDKLQASDSEKSELSFVSGAEFSLGQNTLIKLPGIDLSTLKAHVASLLQ